MGDWSAFPSVAWLAHPLFRSCSYLFYYTHKRNTVYIRYMYRYTLIIFTPFCVLIRFIQHYDYPGGFQLWYLFVLHFKTASWILTKLDISNFPSPEWVTECISFRINKGRWGFLGVSNSFSTFEHQLVIIAQKCTRPQLCKILFWTFLFQEYFYKVKNNRDIKGGTNLWH